MGRPIYCPHSARSVRGRFLGGRRRTLAGQNLSGTPGIDASGGDLRLVADRSAAGQLVAERFLPPRGEPGLDLARPIRRHGLHLEFQLAANMRGTTFSEWKARAAFSSSESISAATRRMKLVI